VDAIAVSSYFSPLNPEHENRAYKAISSVCDLPIVLGHQLSTQLGSVERATTAALNASLLAVLQDFIIAVRRTMESRRIDAPLMVVRGDGTLMSDEFAAQTPVETIHSGPAASAIGGRFLSGLDDALIIDVGGTTADLALIEDAQVTVSEEGATVGGYKTAVRAADLHSIGLGGDSHIRLGRDRAITLGPERVTPLAYLAHRYPAITQRLRALSRRAWGQVTCDHLEYWFLLREPQRQSVLKTTQEKALVAFLRDGPHPLSEIVQHLGVLHAAQIGAEELVRQEVIGKAGLTPTDLMHIEGSYELWDTEAAQLALEIFAHYQMQELDEVRHQVWRQATEMLVHTVITFLSDKRLRPPDERAGSVEDDDIGRWFFYNSLYNTHPHLETQFRLRRPIIGIGAPAGLFLETVAEALHTDLILPAHHPVANALGAVAGVVMVTEEVLVYPILSGAGLEVLGYYVQLSDRGDRRVERREFEEEALEEALAYAREQARERARGAALRSGAENPQVTVEQVPEGLDTYRIRAKAMGNPRLTR
jgi:N-methylhydantoinase A/oxoprolinase/acetone carboxylase beta subunit